MTWSGTFSVTPIAKGRPRMTRGGHTYTPKRTRDAEIELRSMLIDKAPPKLEGALAMSITFYIKRPVSAKGRPHPTKRPDLDNMAKLVLDASNGILYDDDAQICHLSATKLYSEVSRIAISVFPLKDRE